MTRVIIAEDDRELLDVVATALERTGASVVRVESGAELIESLAEAAYDLIITDVSMPWMSGLQVALSLRNAEIQTPLIVMTASRQADLATRVAGLGDRALLLRKPFEVEELLSAVNRMIS